MPDLSATRLVTVSQEDRVILKGEKCGGTYKLRE